jgi:preprotein translocase subunit Sec63
MTARDYYTILGVDQGADSKQIKDAFRHLNIIRIETREIRKLPIK